MNTTMMHHGSRALSSKSACNAVASGHALASHAVPGARQGG